MKMPEPVGAYEEVVGIEELHGLRKEIIEIRDAYSAEQMKQYGRDLLEEAFQIAWKACNPSGAEFGHGYNKAAAEIERGIRQLKEQIKCPPKKKPWHWR